MHEDDLGVGKLARRQERRDCHQDAVDDDSYRLVHPEHVSAVGASPSVSYLIHDYRWSISPYRLLSVRDT